MQLSEFILPPFNLPVKTIAAQHSLQDGAIKVTLNLPLTASLSAICKAALSEAFQVPVTNIELLSKIRVGKVAATLKPLPSVKNVIAVASGKGGVGKSTVTVNLALALQELGAKVGILDADIYGPSIPTLLGTIGSEPLSIDEKYLAPIMAHGLATMSIGYLSTEHTAPMIWRGPIVTKALVQLFQDTLWPELDYLLIDLPPGTGDIQLTLAQKIPVTAGIIVTTPQNLALLDAQKGLRMFQKLNLPVLGVVENMSTFTCPHCTEVTAVFGEGGAKLEQHLEQYGMSVLGQLPLVASLQTLDVKARLCAAIALKVAVQLGQLPKDTSRYFTVVAE